MAKRKMSEAELAQRRAAAAGGHPDGHTCMGCYYRARRKALEGGQQEFPPRADWKAAQELQQAARAEAQQVADTPRPPMKHVSWTTRLWTRS
jgi:hypothetical protein